MLSSRAPFLELFHTLRSERWKSQPTVHRPVSEGNGIIAIVGFPSRLLSPLRLFVSISPPSLSLSLSLSLHFLFLHTYHAALELIRQIHQWNHFEASYFTVLKKIQIFKPLSYVLFTPCYCNKMFWFFPWVGNSHMGHSMLNRTGWNPHFFFIQVCYRWPQKNDVQQLSDFFENSSGCGGESAALGQRMPWANRIFSKSMKGKILNFLHEVAKMISVISVQV